MSPAALPGGVTVTRHRASLRDARLALIAVAMLVGSGGAPLRAYGQQATLQPDAVIGRMEGLHRAGDVNVLRRVVDSVIATTAPLEARYGEALYWRATIRSTPDSMRQDLLRLLVDFPMSPRAEDALVRLSEDEIRLGDRAGARRHLERLVRDHLVSDRGAKAAQELAAMMFAEGATAPACAVLDSARAHVSTGNVELGNQIEYSGRRCAQIHEATAPPTDTVHPPALDSAGKKKVVQPPPRVTAKPPASAAAPVDRRWSVQVAAYAVHGDALRLEARLKARWYAARIVGEKPYRVRIGRFAARDSAATIVARLKAEKTSAIIVEAERP